MKQVRFLSPLLIALTGATLSLTPGASQAETAWPEVAFEVVNAGSWAVFKDLTGDESPVNTDVSSHGSYKNKTIGDMASIFTSFDGTYLYYRWLLSGNPLSWNNSLKTYEMDNRTSWVVLIDNNHDNVKDWAVAVSKSNELNLYQGAGTTQVRSIPFGPISPSGSPPVYDDATGGESYIRVTDTGIPTIDPPGGQQENMHYLDVRVPLAWFTDMTASTFYRPYLGTSTNDNNITKDLMAPGATAPNFNDVAAMLVGDPGVYGALYDARDTTPASSAGTWRHGETVQVTGFGWQSNTTLNIRIYAPDGTTQVYQGTVNTDASGDVSATNSWSIPGGAGVGLYSIYVQYPTTGQWTKYDTFTVAGPALAIDKTGPATAVVGGDADYTLTVSNAGNEAAQNVIVSDPVPADTRYRVGTVSAPGFTVEYETGGAWSATPPADQAEADAVTALRFALTANLDAGAATDITFGVILDSSLARGATVTNTATANYQDLSGSDYTPVEDQATTTVTAPDLAITKTHAGDFTAGVTNAYTITVENVGDAATFDTLTITDTLPEGLSFIGGTGTGWTFSFIGQTGTAVRTDPLAPGASTTLTITVSVGHDAVPSVTNAATVSTTGDTNTANDSASDPTTVNGAPDLALTKTHSGGLVVGSTNVYTILVENVGSAATTGPITVTDTFPANVTYQSAEGTDWSFAFAAGTLTATRTAALAAGTGTTFTITVAIGPAFPTVPNTATVSTAGDTNAANDTATDVATQGAPQMSLAKRVTLQDQSGQPPNPARTTATTTDRLVYALTATNAGTAGAAGLVLTDTVPDEVALLVGSVTSSQPPGLTGVTLTYSNDDGQTFGYAPVANADGVDPNVDAIRWTYAGSLSYAGGNQVVASFTTVVKGGLVTDVALNEAVLTYTDAGGVAQPPAQDSVATALAAPALQLEPDHAVQAAAGQARVFAHTITNLGVAADTLDLQFVATQTWQTTLYLDANNDGVLDAGDPVLTDTDGDGVPDVGSVATGDTARLLVRVFVPADATAPAVDTITLTARSSLDTQVSDNAVDRIDLSSGPLLTAVKYINTPGVTQNTAPPGTTLTYGITVTNEGGSDAKNISVVDLVSAFCTYVPGSTKLQGVAVAPDPYDAGSRQITVPVALLAPGASVTITFEAVIK